MTLPERLAREALPCLNEEIHNGVSVGRCKPDASLILDMRCWNCVKRPAVEDAIREAIEATVELCVPGDSIRQSAFLHRLLVGEETP